MHHEHLTADTVADHLEGLLGPGEAAEAARHLASCPECEALREDLGRLRATLASEAAPPMPASVAARIDLALAEAAETAAAARLSAGGRSPSGREQSAERLERPGAGESTGGRRASHLPRRRRWLPALGGALATIAIVLGTLAVLPRLNGSHDDGAETATAGRGATSPSAASGAEAQGLSPGPASGSDSAAGADGVVRSGRVYTAYTLSAGVRELLAEQDAARAPASGSQDQYAAGSAPSSTPLLGLNDRLAQLSSQPTLAACIQSLVKRDTAPIVVDLATYGGKPAAIIVLPDPADSTNADVYVVAPDCGRQGSTPIATTTVRRPVTAGPSGSGPSGTQPAPTTPSSP